MSRKPRLHFRNLAVALTQPDTSDFIYVTITFRFAKYLLSWLDYLIRQEQQLSVKESIKYSFGITVVSNVPAQLRFSAMSELIHLGRILHTATLEWLQIWFWGGYSR